MRAPCISATGSRCGFRHRAVALLLSGLLFGLVPDVGALAQTSPSAESPASGPYAEHIAEAAQLFSLPKHWIAAVLSAESAGVPRAVSSAGAMGLMQIMPDTWVELRTRYQLGDDPFDPRDNIIAGTAYLREMLDRYGAVGAMLAAYNAGPGRYDEYLATGRALPAETRAYVASLAPLLGEDKPPDGEAVATPVTADWREASIFVTRIAAPAMPDDRTENAAPAAQPTSTISATDAPNSTLFVPLSSPGDAP